MRQKNDLIVFGVVPAVSLVVGSILGYLFAKKELEQYYDNHADNEIKQARDYYEALFIKRVAKHEEVNPSGALSEAARAALDEALSMYKNSDDPEETETAQQELDSEEDIQADLDEANSSYQKSNQTLEQILYYNSVKPVSKEASIPVDENDHRGYILGESDLTSEETMDKDPDVLGVHASTTSKPDYSSFHNALATRADLSGIQAAVQHHMSKGRHGFTPPIEATENDNQNADYPYLISEDEFLIGEKGYPTSTLTYYAGDSVLVDERDEVIREAHHTVGTDNLQRFGEQTSSSETVYVRNDRLAIDFEIVRSHGQYSKEVLGFNNPAPPS